MLAVVMLTVKSHSFLLRSSEFVVALLNLLSQKLSFSSVLLQSVGRQQPDVKLIVKKTNAIYED